MCVFIYMYIYIYKLQRLFVLFFFFVKKGQNKFYSIFHINVFGLFLLTF